MERLMPLDGNGLIYRGYFALPPLSTSKGELVNAVFGFCSIVLRGIQDLQPDYVAVAFDLPGPTFRHERFADYKATRTRMPDDLRDQFPKVREVVKALRLPVFELAGFEADDVIGTLTVEAERRGLDTTIVTGDLDMLQIVSDRVRLMTTRSGVENTILYDPARIFERYELAPSQMIDYKALKGDTTDNIPGVPGVGEKTAAKLIREDGSLDAVYERIGEVKPDKLRDKLLEYRDQVMLGRELSTIVRDLPVNLDLDAARLGDYDRDEVIRLFREYEFRSLLDRLPPLRGESAAAAVEAVRGASASVPAARVGTERPSGWGSGRPIRASAPPGGATPPAPAPAGGLQLSLDFDTVGGPDGTRPPRTTREPERFDDLATALAATIEDVGRIEIHAADHLEALRDWIAAQPMVGVALLLDDPRPRAGNPLALALAGTDGRVVAAEGPDADILRHLLEASGVPIVGHETKPMLVARFGEDATGPSTEIAFDTQLAAYLLNAALRAQTIADVVAERLDLVLPPAKELIPAHRAGLEALSAIASREPLATALESEGLERLFREMELPLVPVLARMEAVGVAIDLDALASLDREF
ncbi:MAG: 5'-3' exonuclease H3TH domain-containing protein, partial [Candidatus Limnocylindrales bacterium]